MLMHETDLADSLIAKTPTDLFLNGQWCAAHDGARFAVNDPATQRDVALVASAGPQDAAAALEGAVNAQWRWSASAPTRRADLLLSALTLLTERAQTFANLIGLESGKSPMEAHGEVNAAQDALRWYAGEALRVRGRYEETADGRSRIITLRRPLGPCLAITPWCSPLAVVVRMVAPALAAGNTCIVKPASRAPLAALAFASLLEESGVPAGVLAVLPSDRSELAMDPLLSSSQLARLSFAGSAAVGQSLARHVRGSGLTASFDMGGNARFLVFGDADLEAAVRGAAAAKLRNAGQMGGAAGHFLVHSSVAAAFEGRLAEDFAKTPMRHEGYGTAGLGPLISEQARLDLHARVQDTLERGARLLTGGYIPAGPGWFYPPTVLADVPPDAPILRTEILGPVAPVTVFDTEDQALRLAAAGDPGLAAFAYTSDIDRIFRLGERLPASSVVVNRGLLDDSAPGLRAVRTVSVQRGATPDGFDGYSRQVQLSVADPL